MSEDKLKALRENLDKIDIEIQTLLIQRAKISLEVKATKQSDPLKIRPGREAEIIRNLISQHGGVFPKLELIRVWREILSASLQSQGNFKIAVFIPDNQCEEGWGYISAARNHFGSYTPLITHPLQRRVVEAVLEDECSVGILPMPERQEDSPWWRHLAVQGNTAKDGTASEPARIIAKIPFAETFEEVETIKSNINPCLVIAKGEADPSGLDETYVVFDLAHNLPSSRIESRLIENHMKGIVVSIWHDNQTPERWLYLICIKEFILKDNVKLDRFAEGLGESLNQVTVLGSYATPLSPDRLI